MLLRKVKTLIYIILLIFALDFILPVCAYAIDKDSVYVWSNSSSYVSTSITPGVEEFENSSPTQDNSR